MTPTRPACRCCSAPARWKIRLWVTDKGERTARLCGTHARELRTGPKVTAAYTVLSVASIEYVGFRR